MKKAGRKTEGFTLAELLIVVAIIAVLVGISIPIFSSQLEKSRLAVDMANVRSAKAAAAAEYMSNDESGTVSYLYADGKAIENDSDHASDLAAAIAEGGYGKSSKEDSDGSKTGAVGTPKNAFVEVTITDGQISAVWTDGGKIKEKVTGDITLTDVETLSNDSLKKYVESLGMDLSQVKTITAPKGSVLEDQTKYLFDGFTSLTKIDLSNATLNSSSYELFDNLSDTVEEVVLPQCTKPYTISGKWKLADGTLLDNNGTRVKDNMSGVTIYRVK